MDLEHQPLRIKVAFLDVGQGDTIVVSSFDTHEAIVVDCINADAVLDYLEQEQIKYLRGVIITHLHADHYSEVDYLLYRCNLVPGISECERLGFSTILDKRNFDKLLQDADEHSSSYEDTFQIGKNSKHSPLENLLRWCKSDKSRYIIPQVQIMPSTLPFNGMLAKNIRLIYPYAIDMPSLESKGLNNTSVVLRVSGINSSALLTGDLEPAGWHVLQSGYPDLRSDILKFPHHGGGWNTEETKTLLDIVQPSVVIISVGTEGEKYKHPNEEVFQTLASPAYSHIQVLCTQATNQCQLSVLDQKHSVIQLLDRQANGRGYKRVASKRGCPCSGTIIIELDNELRVIQPSREFHQDSIILPHFHAHKCVFAPTTPISTSSDMDIY